MSTAPQEDAPRELEAASTGDGDAVRLLAGCVVDPAEEQAKVLAEQHGGRIDWGRANWSNPILQQLAGLSALSNHDLPVAAHRRGTAVRYVPSEHTAAEPLGGLSDNARDVAYDPAAEMRHAPGCEAAHVSQHAADYGLPTPGATAPRAVRPPANAAGQVALDPLLRLSSTTLHADERLGALVREVADGRRDTDLHAGRVWASGTLPDAVTDAQHATADRLRDRPPPCAYNRAFHNSDVVGYGDLPRREASPPSMHDVGYETWMQRAVDLGARDEDPDAYYEHQQQLTSALGRLQAVEERTEAHASAARVRVIGPGPGSPMPAIEG